MNKEFTAILTFTVPTCVVHRDVIFVLDYSASFNRDHLRITLAGLQIINNYLRNQTGTRTALILYPIYDIHGRLIEPSRYVFNYNASCQTYLDGFRNASEAVIRSFSTRAYEALNFLAEKGTINSTRDTAVITVTDGYSDPVRTSIQKINDAMSNIRIRSNNRVTFYGAGINAVSGDEEFTREWFNNEIEALSAGDESHMYKQEGSGASDKGILDFVNELAILLNSNDILCDLNCKLLINGTFLI